jgi:hypothetical protein
MNTLCIILLIAAAGAIGRLWPRKNPPVVQTSDLVPAPVEYGLIVPPGCEEIVFNGMRDFHTYTSYTKSLGVYNSVTIRWSPELKMKFTNKIDYSACVDSRETEGTIR